MPRKTATSVRVDPNIRAARIYPIEETKKELLTSTVGVELLVTAIRLATALLGDGSRL